jgi:hypothetical protein
MSYRIDRPPWNAAGLAAHVAHAHFMTGSLRTAMEWSERSWCHAREGMRAQQGIAVREVMEAYDWSANTIGRIYLRLNEPSEIRRLIDDLLSIQEYARQSIDEFNASSIIAVGRPSGEATPEQLVEGRLAAMLALAESRFSDLRPLAAGDSGTLAGRELRTLLLRAQIFGGRDEQADALLMPLLDSAEQRDDCDAECELAVLAQLRFEKSVERLSLTEGYLPRAEACGLHMHWRDLQLARSRALQELGRRDDARGAAEVALFGAGEMVGAHQDRDWVTAHEAVSLLQGFGGTVPEYVLLAIKRSTPPDRRSPRKAVTRRVSPSLERGTAAREEMHAAALRVIQAYESEGTPFALYFRTFRIEVLHGPFELGPKLTENALRDALPLGIEIITIQDHGSFAYDYDNRATRFRREAPALLIEDERWSDEARALIPFADLIVSEPLMLTDGVRLELQMIYNAHRWDRTVLLLPPQNSFLQLIDNDSLIQMFPRCVWADTLHQEPFADSPGTWWSACEQFSACRSK